MSATILCRAESSVVASWASQLLLRQVDHGDGPLVFGIDEPTERRQGSQSDALPEIRRAIPADGAASHTPRHLR